MAPGLLSTLLVHRKSFLIAALAMVSAYGCDSAPIEEVGAGAGGGIHLDDDDDGDGDADGDDGLDDGLDDGDGDDDGNGSDDGTPGSADDGVGHDAPECVESTFDLAANPPSVMLVLDKSGSMSQQTWNIDGQDVMRWTSLHGVVADLVDGYDAIVDFGAVLFPAVDAGDTNSGFDSMCRVAGDVDVPVGTGAGAAILAAMPGALDTVQGATPARAGLELARTALASVEGDGARAMILVTDGLANCASEADPFLYDAAVEQAVADAAEAGVPTYVVGIDIRDELVDYAQANARVELDAVARAGGVARDGEIGYYDARDEASLYDALDEIAERVECTVALQSAVPADAEITIEVDGDAVAPIGDCSEGDGWRFSDGDARSTIELCGAACDALRIHGELHTTVCEPDEPVLPVP